MLSPLLFNVFLAAVLLVALVKFSEEADILADFAHMLERPLKVGRKTSLECVLHAIGGMLYADDVCIMSRHRVVWSGC